MDKREQIYAGYMNEENPLTIIRWFFSFLL